MDDDDDIEFISHTHPTPIKRKDLEEDLEFNVAKMNVLLPQAGFRIRFTPISGGGNSQFEAVSDQMYGDVTHHINLRRQAVRWLKENKNTTLTCGERPRDFHYKGERKSCLKNMKRSTPDPRGALYDGWWGNTLTLHAMANMLSVRIIICSSGSGRCIDLSVIDPIHLPENHKTIYLSFVQKNVIFKRRINGNHIYIGANVYGSLDPVDIWWDVNDVVGKRYSVHVAVLQRPVNPKIKYEPSWVC